MEKITFVNTKMNRRIEELLARRDQNILAYWAAECAERVLPHFEEKYPEDERPRRAIEAGRAWIRGEIDVSGARSAALAAHDAAEELDEAAAVAAARAAGHAASTADAAVHAFHAAAYAAKSVALRHPAEAGPNTVKERHWQYQRLLEAGMSEGEG